MVNIHPETHIAYGYISSNVLDSDLVNDLLYGTHVVNHSYNEYVLTCAQNLDFDPNNDDVNEAIDFLTALGEEHLLESYEGCEEIIEGCYQGVDYQASWMGGALNFFIFKSPHITQQARRASPCVPNAAILDTLDGDTEGYNVPEEWRVAA